MHAKFSSFQFLEFIYSSLHTLVDDKAELRAVAGGSNGCAVLYVYDKRLHKGVMIRTGQPVNCTD